MQETQKTLEELSKRKSDHLELANSSQVARQFLDDRFDYEPLFSAHPTDTNGLELTFLGKKLGAPLWISSMTGGTGPARHVNQNLARACGEFSLGMGLGSCRSLLDDRRDWDDFALRELIGDSPFYANLGIAQLEELCEQNQLHKVSQMVTDLACDGLIIHVNLLQEWLQPEGDRFKKSPLETIEKVTAELDIPIVVKEVGQGFGPKSLKKLMELPIAAVELAGFGGTNFTQLEALRATQGTEMRGFHPLARVGHSAEEMIAMLRDMFSGSDDLMGRPEIIISGGVSSFLHGHYLMELCPLNCVYGQARAFLEHATGDYSELKEFVESELLSLKLAKQTLTLKQKK
jgi:isopentenyl-diphosphate delta-isomerase